MRSAINATGRGEDDRGRAEDDEHILEPRGHHIVLADQADNQSEHHSPRGSDEEPPGTESVSDRLNSPVTMAVNGTARKNGCSQSFVLLSFVLFVDVAAVLMMQLPSR
jgi:hypothetical protein